MFTQDEKTVAEPDLTDVQIEDAQTREDDVEAVVSFKSWTVALVSLSMLVILEYIVQLS